MALDKSPPNGAPVLRNEQDLHAWLETAPPEVATALAYRAMLRILPFGFIVDRPDPITEMQLLASLRATSLTGLAAYMPGIVGPETAARARRHVAEMAEYSGQAGAAAPHEGVDATARAGVAYTAEAALRSVSEGPIAAAQAITLAAQTASAASAGYDAAYFAVMQGAFADAALPADMLLASPLERPRVLSDLIEIYRTGRVSLFPGGAFAYWATWYDGATIGAQVPWDLQRMVGVIRDKFWRNGPDSVARQIEEARARIAVLTAIGLLEAALSGGAGSDEDEEEQPAASFAAVKLIKDPLQSIKKQTQSVQPQPFLVGKAVTKLKAVEIGIGHWMGCSMDPKAKEHAQAIGKAGGMATAAWLNMHADKLRDVIGCSESWAKTLN